jgi:hypothetical protein
MQSYTKEIIMKTINVLVILWIATFWGCNSVTDDNNTPSFSQIKSDGIVYSLSLPSTHFGVFDTLRATFQVTNESIGERQFNFANIQQVGFQLVDMHGTVALYSPIIVLPALSSLHLKVGEKKEYLILGLFKNQNGQNIERGKYMLFAYLLDGNSPPVSHWIEVK